MDTAGSHGLEAVYRESHAELLRFLNARTGDRAEAEDLMQELWIKISQTPTGPISHGRAYLYRMAQNLMVDRLRERQRRQRREQNWYGDHANLEPTGIEPSDPGQNAEDAMLEREEIAHVASAIANLPPGARRAFELHKLQGLSHGEVAQQLGISRSGVEKHMTVAMKYLLRALLDWGKE